MIIDIFLAVAEIFGLFAIGALARFSGKINDKEIDRWSVLVLDFLLPAFTFNSITKGFQIQQIDKLWPLPFIGLGLVIFGTVAGMIFRFGLQSSDKQAHRSFVYFCAVNNSTYLPVIIIRNLWGDSTLANLFFFNLGTTIGIWTIGISILGNEERSNWLKHILTPTLISVIAGLVVLFTGTIQFVPTVVVRIIENAGSAAIPLMLILIGASLTNREALKISWQVIYITIVRLIILPAIAIIILRFLPISHDVYTISVIVSLMPVAVSSVIMIRRYGGNPNYASSTALISTIASILTIPAALYFLFGK